MALKHMTPKHNALTQTPPLEDRIKQIRADIDAIIDARAEAVAKQSPGVPLGVIRNLLTARAGVPVFAISRNQRRRSWVGAL
jgi:hypothetical protein